MLASKRIHELWQQIPEKERSRSLWFERFADPALRDHKHATPRRDFFEAGRALRPQHQKATAWHHLLRHGLRAEWDDILFAKLQSRLMLNMAGGVMENAGLCVDRFGYPYVPGSAVKGCARRMAIQELLERATDGTAATPEELAPLLADIALVFGWGKEDWNNPKQSDFAYAVGERLWPASVSATGSLLSGKEPLSADEFGHFAGSVSFLPAYPWQLPARDLELDVLTCHHPSYYAEPAEPPDILPSDPRWQHWKQAHDDWKHKWSDAPDTEEPVPVIFPTVPSGIVFAFLVRVLRGERYAFSQPQKSLHHLAHAWLANGLATFGLGAKTAAGYGWFDTSDEFQRAFVVDVRLDEAIEDWAARCERAGGFAQLGAEVKDEMLLELAERKELCQRWHEKRPKSFKPVLDFAQQQEIPLL